MMTVDETADPCAHTNATLPADIRKTIEKGDAVFKQIQRQGVSTRSGHKPRQGAIMSILDPDEGFLREQRIKEIEEKAKGRRGQPPMTNKLHSAAIYVDHLERNRVPFATGRNSRMNKLVREWLNECAANTQDNRKSRRKEVTPDAVRELLKQVAKLRK